MKTVFEYTNVSTSKQLESLVSTKLARLSNKYPFTIRGDIFFKKENKNDNKGHICGIHLSAPGPRLYVSSDGKVLKFLIFISLCIR